VTGALLLRGETLMSGWLQDFFENRDVFNSLELGWDLLRTLPQTMLGRIKMKTLEKCVFHYIYALDNRCRSHHFQPAFSFYYLVHPSPPRASHYCAAGTTAGRRLSRFKQKHRTLFPHFPLTA
jgi:hypothetical protein